MASGDGTTAEGRRCGSAVLQHLRRSLDLGFSRVVALGDKGVVEAYVEGLRYGSCALKMKE